MTANPWQEEEIRAFASIGTGAKDTKDRTPGGKYPFFVRSQKVERIDSWSFDGEAVLTAGDGVGTGKVFHYINGKFDYHQRVYRISNFRKDVSGRYFFYQFSRDFLARIESLTAKSSVDSVRMETIAGMPIALPSREEQERIVGAIDDADALVGSLERLIAKKQAIKQGMVQQLLTGRTRLPGFKSEWSRSTVGKVSEFLTGYPFESGSYAAAGIRLIRGSNVKRGEIDWSPAIAMYWTRHDPGLRAVALRAGDIVIAMDGALVGRSFARITDAQLPAYLVQRVARLRGKAIDQDLLYQWIGSQAFVKHVDDVKTHTAIPHISPRDIRDFKISIPVDVDEQRAIAGVLVDADLQIELLKSRLVKVRAIKIGLMQQLLTGRTRLPVEAVS